MNGIKLSQVMPMQNLNEYKLHVAKWNGEQNPLDVFINDFDEWVRWNEWRGNTDRFSRQYIFSIIHFYPERNTYLFGGIFEVKERFQDRYVVAVCERYVNYIGRLKINFELTHRGSAFLLEKLFDDMTVKEILRESYKTLIFPGYENICFDYGVGQVQICV